jgi:hypothetical protein
MGFRSNHTDADAHPEKSPNQQNLKGIARLVNPREDDPAVVAAEEPGERDYLGRLLRVADEALRHVKQGFQRHRRGRIH